MAFRLQKKAIGRLLVHLILDIKRCMTSLPAWLEKHVFFQTNQAIFLFTVLVELYSSMRRNLYIILAIAFLIAVAPLTHRIDPKYCDSFDQSDPCGRQIQPRST